MKTGKLFILILVFSPILFSEKYVPQVVERPGSSGTAGGFHPPVGGGAPGGANLNPLGGNPSGGGDRSGDSGAGGDPPSPLIIPADMLGAIIVNDTYSDAVTEDGRVIYSMYENLVLNGVLSPVINDFLGKLKIRGIEVVSIPSLTLTDSEALRALMNLEIETVHTVEIKLLGQLEHIQAYKVDTKVQIAGKMIEVKRAEQWVKDITHQAVQQAHNENHWIPISSGETRKIENEESSHYQMSAELKKEWDECGDGKTYKNRTGEAFRQLVQINNTGNWGSN